MTFFTCFRPIKIILVLLTVVLSSGCLNKTSTAPLQKIQPVQGQHSSKIFRPAADLRPYLETEHAQLGKMRWLIDSGATHSVIFDNGKKSLGSIITGNTEFKNNVHGMFSSKRKKLSLFTYQASSHSEGLPTITGYTMSSRGRLPSSRADAILGLSSLKQHHAIILPRQKLLLWNRRNTQFQNTTKINLRRHPKSGHLLATVYHSNHRLHLIVDTGAAKSVISHTTAQKINSDSSSKVLQLSGIHQTRSNRMSVKKLKIRITPSQPEVNAAFVVSDLSNLKKRLASANDVQIDGILGYDIISRHCHAIDFGRSLFYLSHNE